MVWILTSSVEPPRSGPSTVLYLVPGPVFRGHSGRVGKNSTDLVRLVSGSVTSRVRSV